nr:hypothetical protein [Kofleriaceae bacterium]
MTPPPDRLQLLLAQTAVTGIDYVYVYPDQQTLDVYFLVAPDLLSPSLVGAVALAQISITGVTPDAPPVQLAPGLAWPSGVTGTPVLRIQTTAPGGFARYELAIAHPQVDVYYSRTRLDFKANCPSDLDCAPAPHACPPDDSVDVPVDYTARDYASLRQALLDFAAARYPQWADRLEPDAGIMIAELLSALGDEMAYYQDRVAREAYLATATQRRSIRRHARLVDFPIHDGLAAATWLDLHVSTAVASPVAIPAGTAVWAIRDGARIDFAIGRSLADMVAGVSYSVTAACNELLPHIWDDRPRALCLRAGATSLVLDGHVAAAVPLVDTSEPVLGRWVLLRTSPVDPALPARAWPVRITSAVETTDVVLGTPITTIAWSTAQATPFELDVQSLAVHGNLVPATAGKLVDQRFYTAAAGFVPPADATPAVERVGPNGTTAYLWSLPGSDQAQLSFQGSTPETASPEVYLVEQSPTGDVRWSWTSSFVGETSSDPDDPDFVLDDGTWRRVVGFPRPTEEVVHVDYAGDAGRTIRFGDSVFGRTPAPGTVFRARFRLGGGASGNLPAGALSAIDPAFATSIDGVANPLPITSGVDPQSASEVRQLAPEAYRAVTYRAVRPEDYAEAVERLPWVQRAGTSFRWTGSWISAFTTPDPIGASTLSAANRDDAEAQLDRFRQAGREAFVRDPIYADLDLQLSLCVEPSAYRADVKQAVLARLTGTAGFFAPDQFTFGTPLERSMLEAAIQGVPGVRAVEDITYRRRGWFDWRPFDGFVFQPGSDEVIRVDNDPLHPDRGTIQFANVEGGA